MINPDALQNMGTSPDELTDRQRQVADLVQEYFDVAREMPSAGWLSRRLNISRQRAREHLVIVQAKLRARRPLSK